MKTITTEAWVLYQGSSSNKGQTPERAELKLESYTFPGITENEVLAEPLYGCWEANMDHAIKRQPVDVCQRRGEEKIVLGNAGVARVIETGRAVTGIKPGDLCFIFCNAVWDGRGFTKKVFGYDAPQTIGVLAKQIKLHHRGLIPIPLNSRYAPEQWAAFSLRYVTAWANWKAAYGCLRSLIPQKECLSPFIWGWGGGVTLAELELGKMAGCQVAMMSSDDKRMELIRKKGIRAIDRKLFGGLSFDEAKYCSDAAYKSAYQAAEQSFLDLVKENTCGEGVSIFIDYIGLPVVRASLKALACPGVLTTAGWKEGMSISSIRAIECMNWHVHVHTHYARYAEGCEAARFAEERGWMPEIDSEIYSWRDIPQLAEDYAENRLTTYFPLFRINSV